MTRFQAGMVGAAITLLIFVADLRTVALCFLAIVAVCEGVLWLLERRIRTLQRQIDESRAALDELAVTDQERGRYDEPINPMIK